MLLLIMVLVTSTAMAQNANYFGGFAGLSTLSADGRTVVAPASVAISLYKPENGPTYRLFAGRHLNEYLSLEGSYGWNRNRLTLTSLADDRFYEQQRDSSQHSVVGDLLLYFRGRGSWARPYLSAGAGMVRFKSREKVVSTIRGLPALPPPEFAETFAALRVAVGVDLAITRGWAFRYSFSETITRNPVSAQLLPRGQRNLANFQSLFGLVKSF